jgi:hypothetical protein
MSVQGVDMWYLFPGSMFNREIEFRQSQGPTHEFRVRVRESFQVRKGGMVRSDCEPPAVKVTSEVFGGPN